MTSTSLDRLPPRRLFSSDENLVGHWSPPPRGRSQKRRTLSPTKKPMSSKHTRSPQQQPQPRDQTVTPPLIYASLPNTPTELSPVQTEFATRYPNLKVDAEQPFSLWDYLREELLATDFDSHQELKWERVSNFLSIPLAIEKNIGFGAILCLDSFLYTFTILPIRTCFALHRLISLSLHNLIHRRVSSHRLPSAQKADLIRTLLLIVTIISLAPLTDPSKIYHSIRGQDTIKLYVIFNALEIADRLCASIGQDIFDCLFSRSTMSLLSFKVSPTDPTDRLKPLLYFTLAAAYNACHALVMVYQLISLNVAINSYDQALLTLLVSNQFVEIKGSVFKKFEKDNLFQITCADIVERFTLGLMLTVVAFRNLVELSGAEFDFSQGFSLPVSFGWVRSNNVLWTISHPVLTVMVSETLVDWLKHAFITKFNHIRPSVYERYTDVLCRDLSSGGPGRKHTYVDQSPLVARRLGFASLPLAVMAILILSQTFGLIFTGSGGGSSVVITLKWAALCLLFWLSAVGVKIIVGVNLLSYAMRRKVGMDARAAADVINDFGREPVGEGPEERAYNKELVALLDDYCDDASPTAEMGEKIHSVPQQASGKKGKKEKARVPLEELTRFTMVKRIW